MQINEIMRSLGRIEQKTDSTNASMNEIKETLKEHAEKISCIEQDKANATGMIKIISLLWSAIVSAAVSLLGIYISKQS